MAVRLVPVTERNVGAVLKLKTTTDQERFVAHNAVSLAEACVSAKAWYRSIYADDTPVGFVMLAVDGAAGKFYLWRMMVATEHQRQGYGTAGMRLVIEQARRWGATELLTSYVPGEGSPAPFYLGLGFEDTGEPDEGERVLRLRLDQGAVPAAHVAHASKWAAIAEEAQSAAAHAAIAAQHLLARDVPRTTAHGFAASGHLARATGMIQELAEEHAARSPL